MSESRISVINAAVQISRRLGVDVETSRNMLLAAVAEKKLELIIDAESERQFRELCGESVRPSQTRRMAARSGLDSAVLADLAESVRQREIALALPAVCGQVGRAELAAWLDSLCAPELTKASPALIREIVDAIYADPANQLPGGKPPNINELVPVVKQRLKDGHRRTASWDEIQKIGDEPKYKALRRQIGKRLH